MAGSGEELEGVAVPRLDPGGHDRAARPAVEVLVCSAIDGDEDLPGCTVSRVPGDVGGPHRRSRTHRYRVWSRGNLSRSARARHGDDDGGELCHVAGAGEELEGIGVAGRD